MSGAEEGEQPRRGMMQFRKARAYQSRLPRECAVRQGDITRLAFSLLGGRDGAMAFLNDANDELGGRPIDLAIASDEGFARVQQEIARRAALA